MQDTDAPIKEARRTELLNAAGELLTRKPAASLAEIAEYAGIGKATLHRYFASRDDLMLALGYRALALIGEAIAASELERGSVAEALTRLIEALVPLSDKLHFLLQENIFDTHPDFVAADRALQEPVVRLIQRGQASGELRADLPADWMLRLMNYALFATWEGVFDGFVARREAPRLLATTLLEGIAAR
jgi:AcrR family transcriptional regulator